jgi:plastocyanin
VNRRTNNKGGPHNVVFDEDAIPAGVDQEKISMDEQLGEVGDTFSMKFDTAGEYQYYCEPHRGAGMNAVLIVA